MPGKVQIELKDIKLSRRFAETLTVEKHQTVVALPVPAVEITGQEFYILELTGASRRDGVLVSGIIFQQVIYLDEDKLHRCEHEEIPFLHMLSLPGLRVSKHQVQVRAKLVEAEGRLMEEGHAIFSELSVQIAVAATCLEPVTLITGASGVDMDRVSKKRLAVQTAAQEIDAAREISRNVLLVEPAINVVWITSRLSDISADTEQDLVKVRGTVYDQIYYIDQSNRVKLQTDSFPVSITACLPGVPAGEKLPVEGLAVASQYKLLTIPGDKLEWKLRLEIKAAFTGWRFIEAVNSASGHNLQVTRATHIFKQLAKEMELTGKVQAQVELPAAASVLLQVDAGLTGISTEIFDGELVVQGVLCSRYIFLDNQDILRFYHHELPVTIREKLPGAGPSSASQALPGTVSQLSYRTVAPQVVEQSAAIRLPVIIFNESPVELVVELKAAPEGRGRYKLYIVQEGDTWAKISGRFGVPPEVLTCSNPRLTVTGRLLPEQKVFIPVIR